MLYTVKEVAEMSGITIKTLHHYHKIGLLLPGVTSEAGYRMYGPRELERLQEILFYRELDFSLQQIGQMMNHHADRLELLTQQEELLLYRQQRLEMVIQTIRKSITYVKEGKAMEDKELFQGFSNEEEWNSALREQNQYLKSTYEMEPIEVGASQVEEMNEQAAEAKTFMNMMAESLKQGIKHNDELVMNAIQTHLEFLNTHGHPITPKDFAAQCRFFLDDDFHRQMLEAQQTGLAYYLCIAAESYSA